jgi:hypothetical protein
VIDGLEDSEDYGLSGFEAAIIADYDAETAVERELVLRLASRRSPDSLGIPPMVAMGHRLGPFWGPMRRQARHRSGENDSDFWRPFNGAEVSVVLDRCRLLRSLCRAEIRRRAVPIRVPTGHADRLVAGQGGGAEIRHIRPEALPKAPSVPLAMAYRFGFKRLRARKLIDLGLEG